MYNTLISNGDIFSWEHEENRYRIKIQLDEDFPDPREDTDNNICTLACWSKRYKLGDIGNKTEPELFFKRAVRQNIPYIEVFSSVLNGEIENIKLKKESDSEDALYQVCSYETADDGKEKEYIEYMGCTPELAGYYIVELLSVSQCIKLLTKVAVILPLWLYDHSRITISCGDRVYPFNDRWDSSQVGVAIAYKNDVMQYLCDFILDENGDRIREEHKHENGKVTWDYKYKPVQEDNWRKKATEAIQNEVKEYDYFLRGECYGFILEKFEPEDDDWFEIDSCYGFIGDDIFESGLASEVAYGFEEYMKSKVA